MVPASMRDEGYFAQRGPALCRRMATGPDRCASRDYNPRWRVARWMRRQGDVAWLVFLLALTMGIGGDDAGHVIAGEDLIDLFPMVAQDAIEVSAQCRVGA